MKKARNFDLRAIESLNLKTIERELQDLILQAFEFVVEERKQEQTQQEIALKKMQQTGEIAEMAFKGKSRDEVDLVKAGRLAQVRVTRALTRKDSLLDYRTKANQTAAEAGGTNNKKMRVRHSSMINLEYTTSR